MWRRDLFAKNTFSASDLHNSGLYGNPIGWMLLIFQFLLVIKLAAAL
jgi:hypothetical protein